MTERPSSPDGSLSVPTDATPAQAVAIAAALGAHVRDQRLGALAAARDATEEVTGDASEWATWDGNRWQFAGRLEAHGRRGERIRATVPTDPWTAHGRVRSLE